MFPISREQIAKALEFLILEKDLFNNNQLHYVSLFKNSITLRNLLKSLKLSKNSIFLLFFKSKNPKRNYNFQKNNDFCLII